MTLFDPEPMPQDPAASHAAMEEGITRVAEHADSDWTTLARAAIHDVAKTHADFTVDDVWATGLPMTRENRALGAQMRWGAQQGWITPTDRTRKTAQVKSHRAPVTVWKSLICQ